MAKTFEELKDKHVNEAVMAQQVMIFLQQKLNTYSVTTVKAVARHIGFRFKNESDDSNWSHNSFGRIIEYIRLYDARNEFPERTRIILTEKGEVSCTKRREIDGYELMQIFKFPWSSYPIPSIARLERLYAAKYPMSQAAKKLSPIASVK